MSRVCWTLATGEPLSVDGKIEINVHCPILWRCACGRDPFWFCTRCGQRLRCTGGDYVSLPPFRKGLVFLGTQPEKMREGMPLWATQSTL
jgi:hypothetical protein